MLTSSRENTQAREHIKKTSRKKGKEYIHKHKVMMVAWLWFDYVVVDDSVTCTVFLVVVKEMQFL